MDYTPFHNSNSDDFFFCKGILVALLLLSIPESNPQLFELRAVAAVGAAAERFWTVAAGLGEVVMRL